MTVTVVHAYRFALDPTPRQVGDLLRHAGAARVAFNWALAQVKANLGQREAERSYGVAPGELTPSFGWSMYAMRKAWNASKDMVAPWWASCSKEAYATGLDQLARALGNWSDSRKGKRKGPRMGFPRFKPKRRAVPSVRFTTGAIRLEEDRHHVTLPVLGTIKTHESTRKLHRRITNGTATVTSATVRREAGRWFVSFTVEVQRAERSPARPDAVIGVDLGITTLAVCQAVKPKLSLSTRTYLCQACGLLIDRDVNAARNLAALVKRHVAGSGPETQNGRGADQKTRHSPAGGAAPRQRTETSTPHRTPVRIGQGPSPGNGRITETH